MRKITFINSVQSSYGAIVRSNSLSSSSLSNRSRYSSKPRVDLDRQNRFLRNAATTMTYLSIGNKLGRKVDKNIQSFKKSGPKSRLGKIGNDSKLGASTGASLGLLQGVNNAAKVPGTLRQKLANGAGYAAAQTIKGALVGGGAGATVGTARGFIQPNKKKSLLDKLRRK